MAEIIRMPRMSDTMEEGNIVAWLKKVGDKIKPGDVLAEVETDKATMDLDSYQEGTLLYIGVEKGTIPVNGILAIIGKEGEDYQHLLKETSPAPTNNRNGKPNTPTESPAITPDKASTSTVVTESSTSATLQTTSAQIATEGDIRTKASPLAKSLAKEAGINVASVTGSGEGGRIVKRDVEAFIENKPAGQSANVQTKTTAPLASGGYEDVPLSQMRKAIARRLGESKFSAPHFYLTIEVNMDKAIATRDSINAMIAPAKVSFNDLVIKSTAAALKKHPNINSSWMGDAIRRNHDINIGVAVAVDEGLVVPVVNHADTKTLSQINTEVRALVAKAKERKLQPQEMQGNTFTISNLGMFDIDEFTAIINMPDACILAVGSIVEKPIVKNGLIVIGNLMKVTLSCDHRVVDGAMGAQFLQTLKGILEDPIRMIV
ncbi:MAG: pyruvate dehydrogenase complex dihydrolipoamide acetyltransferase [Saprospiraceae bacterium]|nr:pyruvate dehydrogenase complex dihydrolipoamide acetyltransferase [Saprospiraceae bacterium]MBP7679747.1 pyruvate dehydrogenase complex dihydrolipoamide acetyltransferase [Saprospiraceae bacterium]